MDSTSHQIDGWDDARFEQLLAATTVETRSTETIFPSDAALAQLSDADFLAAVEAALAIEVDESNRGAQSAATKFRKRAHAGLAQIRAGERPAPATADEESAAEVSR